MSNQAAASSVLELLNHPNPPVSHRVPPSKSNTRGPKWHCPEKLITWDEFFDFKTLADSFGGRLLAEARRGGRELPCYPKIRPQADCVIRTEKDTEGLINKWNKEVVNAALDATWPEFRTAIWCKGDPPPLKDASESPPRPIAERTQPLRGKSQSKNPQSQSLWGMKSDSGSILRESSQPVSGSDTTTFRREVFPKEYKPAEKWMSKCIDDHTLIDQYGRWKRGKRGHNYAWPIKQAYTYCIQHMCRYGCIVTCREAFIFRVKPLDETPASSTKDPKVLKSKLIQNGLMEYVSIPWDNHHQGDMKDCKAWTVNLALWFVHVLAAVNHEVGWQYDPLVKETLTVPIFVEGQEESDVPAPHEEGLASRQENNTGLDQGDDEETDEETDREGHHEEDTDGASESSDSDGSENIIRVMTRSGSKRKRDPDADEGINFSFSKRPLIEI